MIPGGKITKHEDHEISEEANLRIIIIYSLQLSIKYCFLKALDKPPPLSSGSVSNIVQISSAW